MRVDFGLKNSEINAKTISLKAKVKTRADDSQHLLKLKDGLFSFETLPYTMIVTRKNYKSEDSESARDRLYLDSPPIFPKSDTAKNLQINVSSRPPMAVNLDPMFYMLFEMAEGAQSDNGQRVVVHDTHHPSSHTHQGETTHHHDPQTTEHGHKNTDNGHTNQHNTKNNAENRQNMHNKQPEHHDQRGNTSKVTQRVHQPPNPTIHNKLQSHNPIPHHDCHHQTNGHPLPNHGHQHHTQGHHTQSNNHQIQDHHHQTQGHHDDHYAYGDCHII